MFSVSFYAKFSIVMNIYMCVCIYASMYVNIHYSSVYAHLSTYIEQDLPSVGKKGGMAVGVGGQLAMSTPVQKWGKGLVSGLLKQ